MNSKKYKNTALRRSARVAANDLLCGPRGGLLVADDEDVPARKSKRFRVETSAVGADSPAGEAEVQNFAAYTCKGKEPELVQDGAVEEASKPKRVRPLRAPPVIASVVVERCARILNPSPVALDRHGCLSPRRMLPAPTNPSQGQRVTPRLRCRCAQPTLPNVPYIQSQST